jgi:pimeloyl-ACP methyl ester carboxylesterase
VGAAEILREWEALGERQAVLGHDVFVVDVPARDDLAAPVLVLHGFPTSSLDWSKAVATMRERRRVVLLDMLGYGFSAKPDRHYSLFEQADLVEGVARELGLAHVALVTHDMGDSVGGELCARSLDGALAFGLERRVVTNGSIYLDMANLTDGQKLLLALPDERLSSEAALLAENLASALRATFAADSEVDDDEVMAMAVAVARDGGDRLLPRLIRYLEERRVHEGRWTGAIERHPSPLVVVWGDRDPIAVYAMAEQLVARRPGTPLVRLDGIGHYPMVEAPERFASALRAALA